MRQRAKYSTFLGNVKVALPFLCGCLLTLAPPASGMTASEASSLGVNDYQWDASLAPDGRMNMVVDLSVQRAWVYRHGVLIGISTIASGKPGYETPDGVFKVLEKQKDHHSNKYDDAPMPYMQRLSWDGLALHAGYARGYPASHGCVRLPMGFAAALFREETRGMKVVITGHAPEKEDAMTASADARAFSARERDRHPSPEAPCCTSDVGAVSAVESVPTGTPDQDPQSSQPGYGEDQESSKDVPPNR